MRKANKPATKLYEVTGTIRTDAGAIGVGSFLPVQTTHAEEPGYITPAELKELLRDHVLALPDEAEPADAEPELNFAELAEWVARTGEVEALNKLGSLIRDEGMTPVTKQALLTGLAGCNWQYRATFERVVSKG